MDELNVLILFLLSQRNVDTLYTQGGTIPFRIEQSQGPMKVRMSQTRRHQCLGQGCRHFEI